MTAAADERYRVLQDQPLVLVGASGPAVGGVFRQLREILGRRELLGLLVRRDLKSRYKDSALGFVWTLIRPITQLLIYYVALGKFLRAADSIPDFAIYIFSGLTIWGLFSEIIQGGTGSIIGNAGLVKKVYLPREVFPIASVGAALFNFTIQLGVLIAATFVFGRFPLSWDLLYAIPSIVLIVVFASGLALLLSAVNVYLRDIQYLVEVGLMILMWASPIVYPWQTVKNVLNGTWLLDVYTNNPVTLAVLGFQRAFWKAGQTSGLSSPEDLLVRMGIGIGVCLLLLLFFQWAFSRLQGNFAQAL